MGLPIGTRINYWTTISELYKNPKNGRYYYLCRCMCGHEQPVREDNLTDGHSQRHRGCKWEGEIPAEFVVERKWKYKANPNRTEKDIHLKNSLIGSFFGDWFVVAVDHSDHKGQGHTYYRCLNSKGEIKVARYDSITATGVLRFTKESSSIGERAIKNFLIKHNIPYEQEYIFPDLMGDKSCLRFDFKVEYNNQIVLIEFQGKQHYEPVEFFGGKEQFALQQRYDNYKRQYCKIHNYKLIEIPYTDIDKINTYLNFLQKK